MAGEALLRLVKFLGPMYAAQGESLRTKAAAALSNLATNNDANAKAIAQLGALHCPSVRHDFNIWERAPVCIRCLTSSLPEVIDCSVNFR